MNKKITEKIVSIAICIVSFIFILLLLITTFGHITNADLNNKIVKSLLLTLTFIFAALSGVSIIFAFHDNERLRNVLIFKDKESATQATVAVMKKTAVRVCKPIKEAKIKKVNILSDNYGNVKMKIDIAVLTNETVKVVTKVRATIIATFQEVFGIEFSAIDYRIVKSKNNYAPTETEVNERMEALKDSIVQTKPVDLDTINKIKSDEVKAKLEEQLESDEAIETIAEEIDEEIIPTEEVDSEVETPIEETVSEEEIEESQVENVAVEETSEESTDEIQEEDSEETEPEEEEK